MTRLFRAPSRFYLPDTRQFEVQFGRSNRVSENKIGYLCFFPDLKVNFSAYIEII